MKEPELTKYTWYKKANENFIISKGFFYQTASANQVNKFL